MSWWVYAVEATPDESVGEVREAVDLLEEIRRWRERVAKNKDTLNCATCCEREGKRYARIGTRKNCPECDDYYHGRGKYEAHPCPVCNHKGLW